MPYDGGNIPSISGDIFDWATRNPWCVVDTCPADLVRGAPQVDDLGKWPRIGCCAAPDGRTDAQVTVVSGLRRALAQLRDRMDQPRYRIGSIDALRASADRERALLQAVDVDQILELPWLQVGDLQFCYEPFVLEALSYGFVFGCHFSFTLILHEVADKS